MKKFNFKIRMFISIVGLLFFCITVKYDYVHLWKGIFVGSNVNSGLKAVDSVWYNPENPYHNDTLINTILSDKICYCSENSWYSDYFKAFSKSTVFSNKIPDIINSDEFNLNEFYEVGYSLAYTHATLVNHNVYDKVASGEINVPRLFVRIEGIRQTKGIMIVNDNLGNIYIMSEEYWNEEFK